jgi:hypothetical protein
VTRKNKLEDSKQQKRKLGRVIDVTDDEHFNWLHSMRTPEENERDREVMRHFEETLHRLEMEEEMQKEEDQTSK